jgi:uncharacterized protein
MNRRDIVLAAMAPANGASHTPVQVQKLLFLIDREAAAMLGGPFFNFRPYHYGPFDKTVYKELEALGDAGLVDIHGGISMRSFALTPLGQEQGDQLLGALEAPAQDYIRRASEFVRGLSFSALVSAVYKAYPEMRANSVFQS